MSDETAAPGWSLEFQRRLDILLKDVDGAAAAASIAGTHTSQVYRWRDGSSKMPLSAAVQLCRAAGRSLDWLAALGEGGSDAVKLSDKAILDAAELVVEASRAFRSRLTARDVAEAILSRAYEVQAKLDGLTAMEKGDGIHNRE